MAIFYLWHHRQTIIFYIYQKKEYQIQRKKNIRFFEIFYEAKLPQLKMFVYYLSKSNNRKEISPKFGKNQTTRKKKK